MGRAVDTDGEGGAADRSVAQCLGGEFKPIAITSYGDSDCVVFVGFTNNPWEDMELSKVGTTHTLWIDIDTPDDAGQCDISDNWGVKVRLTRDA